VDSRKPDIQFVLEWRQQKARVGCKRPGAL
jgi:hypothetical protein